MSLSELRESLSQIQYQLDICYDGGEIEGMAQIGFREATSDYPGLEQFDINSINLRSITDSKVQSFLRSPASSVIPRCQKALDIIQQEASENLHEHDIIELNSLITNMQEKCKSMNRFGTFLFAIKQLVEANQVFDAFKQSLASPPLSRNEQITLFVAAARKAGDLNVGRFVHEREILNEREIAAMDKIGLEMVNKWNQLRYLGLEIVGMNLLQNL